MDLAAALGKAKALVPNAVMLTKPINAEGDYLFFSHISFEGTRLRYHFSLYLARKRLRTDLANLQRTLSPLIEERGELLTMEKMTPIALEGLFVVYQLDFSMHEDYIKDDAWLT